MMRTEPSLVRHEPISTLITFFRFLRYYGVIVTILYDAVKDKIVKKTH